jgi:hypothetical protein
VRTHCRGNCAAHRHYRIHAADPNRVIHPRREFRPGASDLAKIDRTASKDIRDIRVVSEKRKRHHDNVRINEKKKRAVETSHERTVRSTDSKRTARRIDVKRVDRGQAGGRGAKEQRTVTMTTKKARVIKNSNASRDAGTTTSVKVSPQQVKERERVVRSTRNSFIKSKSEFTKMREQFVDKNAKGKGVKKAAPKDRKVSKRAEPKVRKDLRKDEKVAQNSTPARTDKRAKRTKK